MKRDMDLCRRILLALEEESKICDEASDDEHGERIAHHIWLLWNAGLVDGFDVSSSSSVHPVAHANCLTWAGHEFLDAARNEGVWTKAKSAVLNATGGASLDLLKRALAIYGQQGLDAAIKITGLS